MSKLRKAFIVSIMGVTVLSMSVVVAPKADAASAGDLIKMDGLSSVYYLGTDNKRYVFPNEATYFSWYSDFSDVVTIPQSELESYPLGANVTMRPGTKLVKITTDPKVYAVEPDGNLVWVPDEATAMALWGDTWNQQIVDVPDAFFTNYTVTGEEVSDDAYPAGSLVKFGEAATVYYIDSDGMARPIADEAAFMANKFSFDDVVDSDLTMPTEGTAVSAFETDLFDPSAGAGGTPGAGSGLTLSVAGDTPASSNVPSCSTLVPWFTFNATAANDGDVEIENLVLTRKGTGATTDFSGGYLFVGDDRLTTKRSVNSSENTVTFTALNLSIPAGMTKAVTLKMNANSTGSACNTTYTGNHYFQVSSASDVTTDGAVVSGSFPVAGNTLAYAAVQASDVTLTGQSSASSYKVGETERILAEFDIANGSEEEVNVYRLRLKQNGSAGDDAISNLSLELDGEIVAEGVAMEDKYVDFLLDNPVAIEKSKTISAIVRGDIVGDIGKTIDLYAKNVADFDVRGTAYGNNYSANVLISDFEAGDVTDITIQGSEINVSFDGPQAADVKDDTKDVVIANFKVKSENLDVNIETMRFNFFQGGNGSATYNLDNIELVDEGNNLSFSVSDPSSGGAYSADFENIYLETGVQYNFELRGDIPNNTPANTTYAASTTFASNFTARFQDEDETSVTTADLSATSLSSKTMTVKAPAVTFSKVTTANATYVENADDVLLYKGKITANSVDDLKVSRVRVTGAGSLTYFGDAFDRVRLYKVNGDGTETELDDETSLSTATYVSFSGFTLDIPQGTSNGVYVVVRGDVKDSPTAGTWAVGWTNGGATTTAMNVKDSDNNTFDATQYTSISMASGQTTTIASKGTFTMAIDNTEQPINNDRNVLAGSEVLVGRIKVTAANEVAKIEDMTLRNLGSAIADDVAFVRLYEEKEMNTQLGEASIASGMAVFEDVNIEIPTTGITYLYVAAVVKAIDYSNSPAADSTATHERTMVWAISTTTGYTVKALGLSTGEELSNSSVTTTTYTKKSTVLGATLSNITTDFANSTLTAGANKKIFSFKVTAPASSNVDYDGAALPVKLATTTFDISTTTGVQTTLFKVERVGGSAGKLDAYYGAHAATVHASGEFVINFRDTFAGNIDDLEVDPGDTAEFAVYATVETDGTNDSLQVIIADAFDADMQYVHNTNGGTAGSDGADTTAVYPRINGVTDITGGTLTN